MTVLPAVPAGLWNASTSIGRSFTIASLLPSSLLVAWLSALGASGVLGSGRPDFRALQRHVTTTPVVGWIALLAVAAAIALILHPLQFPMVRVLEGYWGSSRFGIRAAAAATGRQRVRRRALRSRRADALKTLKAAEAAPAKEAAKEPAATMDAKGWRSLHRRDAVKAASDTLAMAAAEYPEDGHRTLPTRLGNIIRVTEDSAGRPYRLSLVGVTPYLVMVGSPEPTNYVRASREQLDFTVSMTFHAAFALVATAAAMARSGEWAFLVFVPFSWLWLSYRGALASAGEYTAALRILLDLERRQLQRAMGVTRPTSLAEERLLNQRISEVIMQRSATADLEYAPEYEGVGG